MKPFANKVVLITGASAGIGEALAREFASQGASLALLARRLDRLSSLSEELKAQGVKAIAVECDITKPNDLENAVAKINQELGAIDVAVANAGFALHGEIDELKIDDYYRQFETNAFGVVRTYYAVINDLKKTKGNFVIIGSLASFVAPSGYGCYSMSKFAIRAFAECLHIELEPYGVSTTLIAPGFVNTEISQVDKFGKFHPEAQSTNNKSHLTAEYSAKEIVKAVKNRKRELMLGGLAKFARIISRLSPSLAFYILSKRRSSEKK
jgi:short-subunit dehydrogenase